MKQSRKIQRPTKLRQSITPGTVLILLSGRYQGKRVVFLKQLKSGLLLVTGPHKVNGVPLRRVNQAYVIATSTKIDVAGLKFEVDDSLFKRDSVEGVSDAFKAKQQLVDKQLLPKIKKIENLKQYLSSSFHLSKGQYPHAIKF
jgi:large subunit ribosomal protein L6e